VQCHLLPARRNDCSRLIPLKDLFIHHMWRKLYILALILLSFSCKRTTSPERIILDRIRYIYSLKSSIDTDTWPEFSGDSFDVPLVYYTDSLCYVANPTDRFLSSFQAELVFQDQQLSIFKTALLDRIPFHMATEIILGDSTSDYNFQSPYMYCSSPEITGKFVPDVHSTELWATMVLHEYFHGFQYKHPQFLDFYTRNIGVGADTLKALYKDNEWYKESVDRENDTLLKALSSDSPDEIQKCLARFFALRDRRFGRARETLKSDIQLIEATYETMEGTARYVEYSLYSKFASMAPDMNLSQSDTLFHSYDYFKNYSITNDKWLYLTAETSYYYATGFNIARLLDKMGVEYKTRLFSEDSSLDSILREQMIDK